MKNLYSRTCLDCGLDNVTSDTDFRDRDLSEHCLKCDASLKLQGNGSLINRDIAHHHETVDKALAKMDQSLQQVWHGYENGVRLVVGGGRIRSEVLAQLEYYSRQGLIMDYQVEEPHGGSVLVWLR